MNSLHIHVCLGPCGGDALGTALWCSRHKRLPSLTPMPWVQPHARTFTCTVSNEVNHALMNCELYTLPLAHCQDIALHKGMHMVNDASKKHKCKCYACGLQWSTSSRYFVWVLSLFVVTDRHLGVIR